MKRLSEYPRRIMLVLITASALFVGIHLCNISLLSLNVAIVPIFFSYFLLFKPDKIRHIKWQYPSYIVLLASLVTLYIATLSVITAGVCARPSEIWYATYFLVSIHITAWLIDRSINGILAFAFRLNTYTKAPSKLVIPKTILRVILSAAIITPYMLAIFMVHWVKLGNDTTVFDQDGLKYQNVTFQSRDGINLAGWYLPTEYASDSTVVIAPGQEMPKACTLKQAAILQSRGFNVLIFDLRGKGDSAGHTQTFGVDEYKDVLGALDYLEAEHPDTSKHIFGLGISHGATALVKAANYDQRIRAVAIDSAFAQANPLPDHISKWVPDSINKYLYNITMMFASAQVGHNLFDAGAYEQIANISPRPLLIMHGKEDQISEAWQADLLYKLAGYPKTMCVIEGAGHAQSMVYGEGECFFNILSTFNTVRFDNYRI